MSGATQPTISNTHAVPDAAPVERRCENADCNASKLLSMVPKRKTQQFVTEPNVMDKPMLINGFTTVFQVDGASAKLSDLKNVPSAAVTQPKVIYRIVPNTHAHIVNYVVVDAEGESLRKINESDPATMRKLLESQKVSADQMLKKLIAGVNVSSGGSNGNSTIVPGTRSNSNNAAPISAPVTNANTMPTHKPTSTLSTHKPTSTMPTHKQTVASSAAQPPMSNAQIQLPLRMHPNLKITAVASAETVMSAVPPPPPVAAPPTVPLITPVPLSSLQSAPVLTAQRAIPIVTPATAPINVMDPVEKPVFDKMQAELQELRRTVAMLAEAQAKNQMTQQQQQPQSASTTTASALRNAKRVRQS